MSLRKAIATSAKAGRKTLGESRNDPAFVALWLELQRLSWLQDGTLVDAACRQQPQWRAFFGAVDELIDAARKGDWRGAILSAFRAGQLHAEAALSEDAATERKSKQGRDRGTQIQVDRMRAAARRQLAIWEKQLSQAGGKKALAMRRLGIPRATYYKYKRLAKKT